MLKERVFSLDSLDLSENLINDEGLNLLLKGKTDREGHMLFKGLLANDMFVLANSLINNNHALKLTSLEVRGSRPCIDSDVAVSGFYHMGV